MFSFEKTLCTYSRETDASIRGIHIVKGRWRDNITDAILTGAYISSGLDGIVVSFTISSFYSIFYVIYVN